MRIPAELQYSTCLTLLREEKVGRVSVCTSDGPHIVPVNYAVVGDETLVFRTTPYSALGKIADGSRLALEIDRFDSEQRKGWSVVAAGTGAAVADRGELSDIHAFGDPDPWAGGQRWLYVALRWHRLTGRAVGPADATLAG